jgi:hypothetical protein
VLLKKQIDELGEWFQDTYPDYGFTVEYTKNTTEKWEEYYLILEGPEKFKKCIGLIIKDEWQAESVFMDNVLTKFVPANQRAIAAVIDAHRNKDLAATIQTNEVRMTIPTEAIEELEAKASEQ